MSDASEPHEIIDLTVEEKAVIRTEAPVTEGGVPETDEERTRALEAVLFVATEPLSTVILSRLLEVDQETGERLLAGLGASYDRRQAGLTLRQVAGGWRLSTHPSAAPVVERFVLSSKHSRLTKASLETLAIVAYKQPVTRHQIASIRGVNSDSVLRALVERGLVAEVAREEGPGRPLLYGTTPEFLERTGLNSVADLPSLAPFLGENPPGDNRRGFAAEQDPAVVGDESGEPEREEPGEPGPDAPQEPAETETEDVPSEAEREEDPGDPASPGSPDPDRGMSGAEDSPDPDRPGG